MTLRVKDQIMHPRGRYTCYECNKLIQRNVAITEDGQYHHFGCLKKGHARPAYHCQGCGAELTRAQVSKTYVQGVPVRGCSQCGSTVVESIRDYYAGSWGVIPR